MHIHILLIDYWCTSKRYDTIEEINVDSKAEYTVYKHALHQSVKLNQPIKQYYPQSEWVGKVII